MTDNSTKQALRVATDGIFGPHVTVPVSQLEDVRQLLDANKIRYSGDEMAISLNGESEVSWVKFGRGTDLRAVQQLLDSMP